MVAKRPELWFNGCMLKAQAIELLGGTVAAAAEAIGVTYQAVDKWPDPLPQRIEDRVHAALWRKANGLPNPGAAEPEPEPPTKPRNKPEAEHADAPQMAGRRRHTHPRTERANGSGRER
jgi:transcriptional repressor of cell division inhibition gene dicB